MSSVVENIGQLAERLREAATDAVVEFTAFPSGSAMLDVRRQGRLFVMAFSPSQGFGVDEVRDGEGLHNAYQFVFSDFRPAADKLWELTAADSASPKRAGKCDSAVQLSLVVVHANDIGVSKRFYETLGLTFVREEHGGPEHYAAQVGSTVFEIYPRKGSVGDPAQLRIGFCVPSVDESIALVAQTGAQLVRAAHDSPWGRRAVVKDPDGNTVEICSHPTA